MARLHLAMAIVTFRASCTQCIALQAATSNVAVHYLSPFSNVFDTLQEVPDRQDICSHKPVPNARGLTDN